MAICRTCHRDGNFLGAPPCAWADADHAKPANGPNNEDGIRAIPETTLPITTPTAGHSDRSLAGVLVAFGLSPLALPDAAEAVFCWRSICTRGIRKVPTGCGTNREYDTGLCWRPCRNGYRAAAPRRPRDDGAFCLPIPGFGSRRATQTPM